MFSRLFKLFILIVCLGVVALAATAGLLATESGSRWLVQRVIDQNNIPLTIGSIQGRLLDTISFHDVHYRDREGNEIQSAHIRLDWSAVDLLVFHLNITAISVDRTTIKTADAETATAPQIPAIKFPALPVSVDIHKLELNNTRIVTTDSDQLIERIRAGLIVNADRLELQIREIQSADHRVTGTAVLVRKKVPELDVDLRWTGTVEGGPGNAHLQLQGPQQNIAVLLDVDAVTAIRAHGKLDLSGTPPAGTLQGEITGELPQVISEQVKTAAPVRFSLAGNLEFIESRIATKLQTASGELLDFEMQANAALPGPASETFNTTFNWNTVPEKENTLLTMSGQGDIEYRNAVLSIYHETSSPYATHLTGDIDISKEPDLDVKLNWHNVRFPFAENRTLQMPSGNLNVAGTLDALTILARTRFVTVSANNNTPDTAAEAVYTQISMDGEMDMSGKFPAGVLNGSVAGPVPDALREYVQELQPLHFNTTIGQETMDLAITGNALTAGGTPFMLTINGRMDTPSVGRERITANVDWSVTSTDGEGQVNRAAGSGEAHYQDDRLVLTHNLLVPFPAQLEGNVAFFEDRESILRIDLDWQGLEYPPGDSISLQSERGHIQIEGPLSSLAIRMQTRIQTPPAGTVDLDVTAHMSGPVLEFTRLNAGVLDGSVAGSGRVTFEDISRGRFELDARNLNLETINPDLVSRIDLTTKLDFSIDGEELNGRLQIPSLSGKWRGHPLQGNADVSRVAGRTHIRELHLSSGENTIDLQLEMDKLLTGYLDLSISDMSVFSSGLAGSVNGRFDIGGSLQAPRLDGRLQGENIHAFDLQISAVEAESLIDLRPQQQSLLDLRASDLRYGNRLLDTLTLNGRGLTESHSLEINATGEDLQLTAALDGQLRDRNWRGLLNRLDINTPLSGEWKLDQSADLDWQGETGQFTMGSTCLVQNDANLCLSAAADLKKDLQGNIHLGRVPMRLAQLWLPDTVSLNGTISGDVLLSQVNERWEVTTDLQGAGTQINLGFEEDRETLDVPEVALAAVITQQKREWNLLLGSPGYFDVSLEGSVVNTGGQPVAADLKVDLYKIDWLAGIDPDLSGSKGKFSARIQAAGTIEQPQIQGEFNLSEGQLRLLPIGLTLDQIHGDLRTGTGKNRMQMRSVLGSGGKQLELNGHISLVAEEYFPYELVVQGDNFPVIRTADITMDASPDLKLNGTTELHHVRGNVTIPLLDMQVTSLPEDSVSVSPDTVIVNAGGGDEETVRGNDFIRDQLDIDISVTLGPDIHIQGFGLDTRVAGDLNVEKPVGVYQPRGEGFLNLSEGSYQAYGQDLVIEKGQLQFAGPIDNPGINVRAYRPNLNVRPGVNVRGNIRQPQLSLYSEPALSDADTLSYLLTGRPISGVSSDEDANLLARAALALGTRESTVLAREIESMFGLEQFTVGAGDTYQSTSISATKRLAHNLTLSPSFNPFNQLWTFIVNYQLTDHWSIQTESGISQAGDIIYSVETDKVSDLFRNIWTFD